MVRPGELKFNSAAEGRGGAVIVSDFFGGAHSILHGICFYAAERLIFLSMRTSARQLQDGNAVTFGGCPIRKFRPVSRLGCLPFANAHDQRSAMEAATSPVLEKTNNCVEVAPRSL